jgi:hypothetical protein
VAELIIGLMLIEMMVLAVIHRKTGRGVPPPELGVSLAAGIALLLALRDALAGSPWQHAAMWLLLALFAHVAYLALGWRSNRVS